MDGLESLPIRYPYWTYLSLAPALALGALSSSPSLPPLVLLIAVWRLHAAKIIPNRDWLGWAAQVIAISLAINVTHLGASWIALSSPLSSIFLLVLGSIVTTAIAAAAVTLGYYLERALGTPWALATIFPATWATAWAVIEYCSPIGQLATWSPTVQLGGYAWLRQVGGQVAINWVVAAWAVVFADAAGNWIMGSNDLATTPPPPPPLIPHANGSGHPAANYRPSRRPSSTLLLAGLLLFLAIPSYFLSDFPTQVVPVDVTPFGVGCALPFPMRNGSPTRIPVLDDYIAESRKLQSTAQIVLWPETAVTFHSRDERQDALNKTMQYMNRGVYYGIGFEEVISAGEESPDGIWRVGMKRNGLVLLSSEGVVFTYYKRNLVPIAESFSMTPSNKQPTMFTMDLKAPRGWQAISWAPGPNHTRPVTFTASICLDFATSSSFADLPTRPALILAPARTWHTSIGLAMWEQAKARAEEQGSMVLWCDGGKGGVSGVAGRGMHAFRQLGPGSWSQVVSIPWPYNQRRTVFSIVGTSTTLLAVWTLAGLFSMVGRTPNNNWATVGGSLVSFLRRYRQGGEQQPLLG